MESTCLAGEVLRCDRFQHWQGDQLCRLGAGTSSSHDAGLRARARWRWALRVAKGPGRLCQHRVAARCKGCGEGRCCGPRGVSFLGQDLRTSWQDMVAEEDSFVQMGTRTCRKSKTFGTSTRPMSRLLDFEWQGTSKAASHPAHLNDRLAQTCRHPVSVSA